MDSTLFAAISVMVIPDIPVLMINAVQIDKQHNFIYRGTTVGCLAKAFVGKTLKCPFFVTVNVAVKVAVTYTNNQACDFLSQSVVTPTAIGLFESHQSSLL